MNVEVDNRIRSPRSPTFSDSVSSISTSSFDESEFFTVSPTDSESSTSIPHPPDRPLPFIWTCHKCHSRWPLGATRRCLVDGHYLCSVPPNQQTPKKRKKSKKPMICSTEFDYPAWKEWGEWRRRAHQLSRDLKALEGCIEDCDFPSQCIHPAHEQRLGGQTTATTSEANVEHRPTHEVQAECKLGTTEREGLADEEEHRSRESIKGCFPWG